MPARLLGALLHSRGCPPPTWVPAWCWFPHVEKRVAPECALRGGVLMHGGSETAGLGLRGWGRVGEVLAWGAQFEGVSTQPGQILFW